MRSSGTSRTARSRGPNEATKHQRVAEWIEPLGRPDDHAEMLAYHWHSALELVRAAGGDDAELVDRARERVATRATARSR